MKNQVLKFMLLATIAVSFVNCKKEGKDDNPTQASAVTNPPPAGGDYWIIAKHDGNSYTPCWTQDFVTFKELSTDFRGAGMILLNGDTGIFIKNSVDATKIYMGPVSNPSNFKTITSSRTILAGAGYINGTLVASSQDGNNNYVGYCNTKKGETAVNYTFLSDIRYNNFSYVRNMLIARMTISSTNVSAYSYFANDSLKWMVTFFPYTGGKYFDGGNNIIVAYNQGFVSTTSDLDLSAATWTETSLLYVNTSDTAGSFMASSFGDDNFFNVNNQWRVYGYIQSNVTGKAIPAVNISTNQGATWTTTLLTGISESVSGSNRCFVSKTATFMCVQGANTKVFKSTDGINFTEFLTGADAEKFFNDSYQVVYIK